MQRAKSGEIAQYIAQGKVLLLSGENQDGSPLSDYDRRRTERMITEVQPYLDDTIDLQCEYPEVTFDREFIPHLGSTEIQIRHDFRANTPGDAYVWLPQQRVLITGDILVHLIPYAYDGFTEEWIQQLDSMIRLEPSLILPGHGELSRDTVYIGQVRDALTSLMVQMRDAYSKGVTTDSAMLAAVDMESQRAILAGNDPDNNWAFENYFLKPAVRRMLKELAGALGDYTTGN